MIKLYQLAIFAAVMIANYATDWDSNWWVAIVCGFCLAYYLTVWPIWLYDLSMRWQYRIERLFWR